MGRSKARLRKHQLSLAVLLTLGTQPSIALADPCDAQWQEGESHHGGPEYLVPLMGWTAAQFRHCRLPHLDYSTLFERAVENGQCGPNTEAGRQLLAGDRTIREHLDGVTDAEIDAEFFTSYPGLMRLEGRMNKAEFCTSVARAHRDLASCIADEATCATMGLEE